MPTSVTVRTPLRELQAAWPRSEEVLLARFRRANVEDLSKADFLDFIVTPIEFIGEWLSPNGASRIFYLHSGIAVAMTLNHLPGQAKFCKLTSTAISRIPLKRK